MGVPKFFRFISERYPCLSELVRESQIPDFDNLYLDMNGIIHNCSHPDDNNVHFRITEEQIFRAIFHYIEMLFRMIRPKKLFFMAVDGVAPRAKMNQQRGRRFRSDKDAKTQIENAVKAGTELPATDRFDSNCITPGTPFMARLQEALMLFVQSMISSSEMWQGCRVILSGHETPGEGEHKIMDYIRYMKAQPGYDPNTRHCLYGLDADLIILGLATHELRFSLLREEVKFDSKAKKATSVDDTNFFLLHLGLMREYLDLEFVCLKDILSFEYDTEKILDDWVLMGFLMGNDFVPHLPNLHINKDALPILHQVYRDVLPKLDGYINENGKLNLQRFQVFMERLSKVDYDFFEWKREDFEDTNFEAFGDSAADIKKTESDLQDLIKQTEMALNVQSDDTELLINYDDESCEELLEMAFTSHKRDYYIKKLGYDEMTETVLAEQTECYIRALQWILSYYYHGIKSWSWYYPHHYAPYMSDIRNFGHLQIHFVLGKPFMPFEQLLAVLPSGSKAHLPEAYWPLMTDPQSEVFHYYPVDFQTDLNGKKQEWEAVVLIPFIDENLLLTAMSRCTSNLTVAEIKRNVHGPMLQYDFSDKSQGEVLGVHGLATIKNSFCIVTEISRESIAVPVDKLLFGVLEGALREVYFPGFPTMKHLEYKGMLQKVGVKVFDMPSRSENMMLKVEGNKSTKTFEEIAAELLDKEVFVSWPHLTEAKVIAVSNDKFKISADGTCRNIQFSGEVRSTLEHHRIRKGIDCGEINVIVHVAILVGQEYVMNSSSNLVLSKTWSTYTVNYPEQVVVRNITVQEQGYAPRKTFEDVYAVGSPVFMLSSSLYGSQGEVLDTSLYKQCKRIKVKLLSHQEPDFDRARVTHRNTTQSYVNTYTAASSLGITTKIINRLTGNLTVVLGEPRFPVSYSVPQVNCGLQLMFRKTNEELRGYTHKIEGNWLYSEKAVELIRRMCERYPRLLQLIVNKTSPSDYFFESELFPGEVGKGHLEEIRKWIKDQVDDRSDRCVVGTQYLDEPSILAVMEAVEESKKLPMSSARIQIKPHLTYKPGLSIGTSCPDNTATFKLFDRVIFVSNSHTVPLGLRGTIIGLHPLAAGNPVRQECVQRRDVSIEVLFDREFSGAYSINGVASNRVAKVAKHMLINITFGKAQQTREAKPDPQIVRGGVIKTEIDINQSPRTNKPVSDDKAQQLWDDLKTKKPLGDIVRRDKKTNTNDAVPAPLADTTYTLKKILGIPNNSSADHHVIPGQPAVQAQKISLEDMFRAHAEKNAIPSTPVLNTLPQPPPNWRRNKALDAQTKLDNETQQHNQMHPLQPPVPPTCVLPMNVHPMQQPMMPPGVPCIPIMATPHINWRQQHFLNQQSLQQQQQFPGQRVMRPMQPQPQFNMQRPKGPQNLVNSLNGAFIPLQAARKVAKASSVVTSNVDTSVKTDYNMAATKNEEIVSVAAIDSLSKAKEAAKKPILPKLPRKSRIAARFDVSH